MRERKAEYHSPFLLGAMLSLVLFGGASTAALAQPAGGTATPTYEKLPVEDLKKNTAAISQIQMTGQFGPGQKDMFTDYYEKFALARWTDPKNINSLPAYRKELRNSLARRGSGAGPEVHDYLGKLLLDFMGKIVAGRYHPAVQLNAMLLIGELNSVEGMSPTPLPAALDILVASASDTKLSAAVRAAAMVGIQRHATLRASDEAARRTILAAVSKLATAEPSSDDVGGQWVLSQAIETLARFGALGEDNAAFNAMVKALSDRKLSLSTRAIAANALGRLNYERAAGIKPEDAAAAVGQFVVDACTQEIDRAKQNPTDGVSARRMKQYLVAAATALAGENDSGKGLTAAAREQAQRAFIAKLNDAIKTASKTFDNPESLPADLEVGVDDLRAKVDELTKAKS